jgi:hypothetical protein
MQPDQELNEKLKRLLDAADKLLPKAGEVLDWQTASAARWRSRGLSGRLEPLKLAIDYELEDLLGIETQKASLEANTRQFVKGLPANNVLLWGARGTGKSSLVKALLKRYAAHSLRMIEVDKTELKHLDAIVAAIEHQPYRFIIYCDDLSFDAGDSGYQSLKSLLDGSLSAASEHVLIYATSNRRHLVAEPESDNRAAAFIEGELHQGDVTEERLALADRFGIWLSFYAFNQEQYLELARHWVAKLAVSQGLAGLELDEPAALAWALGRASRSGRTAQQFARAFVGGWRR